MIPNKEDIGIKPLGKRAPGVPPRKALAAHLHPHGMRVTPQKLAVFKILERDNYHPTPDMVFAEVRKQYPMVSLGTVYQILDQFARIGVARRIFSGGNRQRFDGKRSLHAHLVCEQCGRIDDFEDRSLKVLTERFARKVDFHIRDHYFEFSGSCADCITRRKRRNRLE
jgi:Fur family transcriptional regulator, peroxide stress response regulator